MLRRWGDISSEKKNANESWRMHPSTKSARAGHIFDECDGDGPPKGGFLGDENAMQTSMCVGTQSKFVPNAIVTAHQKVESGETKMQKTKKPIVLSTRGTCHRMRWRRATKRWIWGKRNCIKHKQLFGHAGKCVTNAMETARQKVDLEKTNGIKNK